LRPWEFARIESVQEFHDLVNAAIFRRQWQEDLVTLVRLSILQAAGVTFDTTGAPPKPNAPTFEKIAGRAPMDLFTGKPYAGVSAPAIVGQRPAVAPESVAGAEAPISEKAQRAMARIEAANFRKGFKRKAKKDEKA
jgi:hypothetical protein